MKIYIEPNPEQLKVLFQRAERDSRNVTEIVKEIYNTVAEEGTSALRQLTLKLDGVDLQNFKVNSDEYTEAFSLVSEPLRQAIGIARENITKFHSAQRRNPILVETMPGIKCWTKNVPIERVGLYVPGGSAPLFSSVLMLAVPALEAGCKEIILCTPPNKEGKVHPAILYAAKICGVHSVYKVGGAQAIAAMTLGSTIIPKVDKIFGPGNAFVTEAKIQALERGVAIDLPAGPSEVMIVADESSNATFVASDMLAQMEHGADSQAITLVNNEAKAIQIAEEFNRLMKSLSRADIIHSAKQQSCIIVLSDKEKIIDAMNQYAPEHLIIQTSDAGALAEQVIHAGSVFVGNYTPESAGDYASGTNHTLPTYGFARSFSGVNLDSFFRQITFQEMTPIGARNISNTVIEMAKTEGLDGHALAMELRSKS